MLVDIDLNTVYEIALKSLEEHYKRILEDEKIGILHDKKLKKAFKRAIEYYGGTVDNG